MPTVSLELCQVKPQGLLDQHDAVTSPGASVGAACGPSLFTHYCQPVWVSLLHRSERKPHRLCPSQQWCVHRGLPLQPQTSHQHGNSSWWKGAAPLSPMSAGFSGAGSVTIPGLSQCQCFAESPVLSLCTTMCCQASASESCGQGAVNCILAGHFLLLLGLLVHPQWPGLG